MMFALKGIADMKPAETDTMCIKGIIALAIILVIQVIKYFCDIKIFEEYLIPRNISSRRR
jgi:hypothetical protein